PRNVGLTGLGTVGLTGLGTVGLTGLGTVGLTGLGTVGLTGLGTVGLTGLGTVGLTGLGTVGLTGLGTVGLTALFRGRMTDLAGKECRLAGNINQVKLCHFSFQVYYCWVRTNMYWIRYVTAGLEPICAASGRLLLG
uniref:Uncharacterized protein n=1 Tax=Oncorhynchus kisutch TaxID=8019 RepID=A0A8C7HML5_ONCKI